jgi:hypothetical protein
MDCERRRALPDGTGAPIGALFPPTARFAGFWSKTPIFCSKPGFSHLQNDFSSVQNDFSRLLKRYSRLRKRVSRLFCRDSSVFDGFASLRTRFADLFSRCSSVCFRCSSLLLGCASVKNRSANGKLGSATAKKRLAILIIDVCGQQALVIHSRAGNASTDIIRCSNVRKLR